MTFVLLFLAGVISCFGVCGLSCSVLVVPYLVLTAHGYKQILNKYIGFIIPKFFTQMSLFFIAILAGHGVLSALSGFKDTIYTVLGIIIIIIGCILIFRRENVLCFLPVDRFMLNREYEHHLLGAIMGLFPCLPRVGIISFVAFKSESYLQGIGYALSYSLGEVLSLYLLLNVFHILLTKFLSSGIRKIITGVFGVLLIVLGCILIHTALTK